ncbi:MAG: MmcB family DNA repair protein [Hyphomicrobiales bacterium]
MSTADNEDHELVITDGRQSLRAAEVQRGVCRLFREMGFATIPELSLSTGRRADIVAINRTGEIWIVEIKSSVEDFRADTKWPDYWADCDRLFFAVPHNVPQEILPVETGLIVADRYGAEVIRPVEQQRLPAARRKAVILRFARAGALRLHGIMDPDAGLG